MGSEKVRKILNNLGLTEKETEVYLFLAKHGTIRGGEIIKGLRMHRADVYRILKRLQMKALVEATLESPARFAIVPFENVLESFIKAKHDEAFSIENARQDLLDDWKNISKPATEVSVEKFTVVEGSNKILSKMQQMVRESTHSLSMATSVKGLARAEQFGIFDSITSDVLNPNVEYRILTDVSNQNLKNLRAVMKRTDKKGLRFRAKNPALKLKASPSMVVRDGEELLFFITPALSEYESDREVCLLTNCKALVESFNTVFDDLWENAAGIEGKIGEIVAGSPVSKVCVIEKLRVANRRHKKALRLAKEQILMTTSSEGLVDLLKDSKQLNGWAHRNVSVKIMAPIMGTNLAAAMNLPEFCEVRHIPYSQVMTSIVDGQALFQFDSRVDETAKQSTVHDLAQAFYTDDPEYIEKTRIMLEDLWRNSYTPSATTLSAILSGESRTLGPIPEKTAIKDERFTGIFSLKNEMPKPTEKEVLHKMLSGKKYSLRNFASEGIVDYGSRARAVIHPPDEFELPELMIEAVHHNKNSSIGQEDGLRIYWRPKTSDDCRYTLAAVVTDSALAAEARKTYFSACNKVEQIQVVKENELQVRIFGNTLFACWSVPIPLGSSSYVLPPACILYEGYGEIRTKRNVIKTLDGQIQVWEINDYEAFVTFFHPKSKYAGPGTDGEFARDCVITTLPPSA